MQFKSISTLEYENRTGEKKASLAHQHYCDVTPSSCARKFTAVAG